MSGDLELYFTQICKELNLTYPSTIEIKNKKWVVNGANSQIEEFTLLGLRVNSAIHNIKKTSSYEYIFGILDSHPQIVKIRTYAGYHTTTASLLDRILRLSFSPKNEKFYSRLLKQAWMRLLEITSFKKFVFSLTGRVRGVNLEAKKIKLSNEIELTKIVGDDEINARQPLIENLPSSYPVLTDLSDFNTEVTVKETLEICPSNDGAYFDIYKKAQEKLLIKCEHVLQTLKLFKHGRFELYDLKFDSDLIQGTGLNFIKNRAMFPTQLVQIIEKDSKNLNELFNYVEKVIPFDKILQRSFSRYLIGVDEDKVEERIVDFVIAFESIFLTVNGSSITSESSYRFALNGAALISKAKPNSDFEIIQKILKTSYDIRSKIVHGAETTEHHKSLNKINLANLPELSQKLSEFYQSTVKWLCKRQVDDRPYNKGNGWEKLLLGK